MGKRGEGGLVGFDGGGWLVGLSCPDGFYDESFKGADLTGRIVPGCVQRPAGVHPVFLCSSASLPGIRPGSSASLPGIRPGSSASLLGIPGISCLSAEKSARTSCLNSSWLVRISSLNAVNSARISCLNSDCPRSRDVILCSRDNMLRLTCLIRRPIIAKVMATPIPTLDMIMDDSSVIDVPYISHEPRHLASTWQVYHKTERRAGWRRLYLSMPGY